MGAAIEQLCQARLGTLLRGKWKLDRILGIGGMAAVYAGEHRIGRRDAIKILHPEFARQPELRKRFEIEASATNRFHHPGAVEIRDFDMTEDGCPFLVMEMLEGESLGQRARRLGEIDEADLLRYVDELLDVLASAHKEGIVHRDIKLDNVFITAEGRVKVLDFGIARMRSAVPLTMAGTRLGTTAYMPPEQLRGGDIDGRADLFAVGATMFRLVAKRRVHEAPTDGALVLKMSTEPAPRLRAVAAHASPHVALVVDRALEFEANDRYPNALTMQADVRAVREGRAPDFALARSSAAPAIGGTAYEPTGAARPARGEASAALEATSAAAPAAIAALHEPTAATAVPPKGPGGTLVTEPTAADPAHVVGASAAAITGAASAPNAYAPALTHPTPSPNAHAPALTHPTPAPSAYAPAVAHAASAPGAWGASASFSGSTNVSAPPAFTNGFAPASGPISGGAPGPAVPATSASAMAFVAPAVGAPGAASSAVRTREEGRGAGVLGFVLIGLLGLVTLGGAIVYFATRSGAESGADAPGATRAEDDDEATAKSSDAEDVQTAAAESADVPASTGAAIAPAANLDIPPPDRDDDVVPGPGLEPATPGSPPPPNAPARPAPALPTLVLPPRPPSPPPRPPAPPKDKGDKHKDKHKPGKHDD